MFHERHVYQDTRILVGNCQHLYKQSHKGLWERKIKGIRKYVNRKKYDCCKKCEYRERNKISWSRL